MQIIVDSGVKVRLDPNLMSELGPAAKALVSALKAEGIDTTEVSKAPDENPKAIHVIIGMKP